MNNHSHHSLQLILSFFPHSLRIFHPLSFFCLWRFTSAVVCDRVIKQYRGIKDFFPFVTWRSALQCSSEMLKKNKKNHTNILKINSKSHEPTIGPFVIPNWKGFETHLPISFIVKESSPIILKMVLGYSLEIVPVSKWVRLKVCTKSNVEFTLINS